MKEVSCRAFEALDRAVRDGSLLQEELLCGVPYPIEFLRNKHERIEWAVWCRLASNASRYLTPRDFEKLGAAFASSKSFRAVMTVARLLYRPARFMHWMQGMQREGKGMFTCVRSVSDSPSLDRVTITLTIDADYEDCPEFFYITKGTLEALPPLLGSPDGTMRATIVSRKAIYEMDVPPQEGFLRRVGRVLLLPVRAGAAADLLQETHEVLLLRYAELETAQNTLDKQAKQLKAAHTVNQALQERVDLATTLLSVTASLHAVLAADGVEVSIACESEGEAIAEENLSGHKNSEKAIVRELQSRDGCIGKLRVWPKPVTDSHEVTTTLDFVLPNILIAIENAIGHDSLLRYRDALEVRVAERTKELLVTRDALTHSLTELKVAQAAREKIFANINHDIRTPLAIVRLASEEARRANRDHQEVIVEDRLVDIDRGVVRLLRLVDHLLTLAALDEDKLTLCPEPIQLAALIRAEVEAWEPLARKHEIALTFTPQHEHDEWVNVDAGAIASVVGNLLSNAIKFTPSGGAIRVEQKREKDCVLVSVTDSGIGMSEEFAERAFDRFSQGPTPVRATGRGSGIGLSVVREIVEAHGGTARAKANRKGGSCFSLTLPRTDPVDHEQGQQSRSVIELYRPISEATDTAADSATQDSKAHSHCVLVAEDEVELRTAMIRCLSPHYRVLSAGDGQEALSVAMKYLPDMLVADISMPKMDGLELTRRFNNIPKNRAARTLLVTARNALESRLAGFDAGAVDYISKPFHPQELLARVKAQLAIRDVVLQLHEAEKMASIGLLGAGLAHELRNPMNAFVNSIAPLRRALPQDLRAEGSLPATLLKVMQDSATRMQNISKSIFELENTARLTLEQTPVRTLITGAIESVPTLPMRKVQVHCDPSLSVACSPTLLLQVFTNIVANAVRAAGSEGEFEIKATELDGTTTVQFSDDGPGIEPSQRERVFEPFFTTADPGQGTGLGLAISRRAVQRHGGTLRVLDVPYGCTFEVKIRSGENHG